MPSSSKSQQRLFGMVHACQKSGDCASPEVSKIAKGISYKDAKDFAKTKHKGLPERKEEKKDETRSFLNLSFMEYVTMREESKNCQCTCKECKAGDCSSCSHKDCNCANCSC